MANFTIDTWQIGYGAQYITQTNTVPIDYTGLILQILFACVVAVAIIKLFGSKKPIKEVAGD